MTAEDGEQYLALVRRESRRARVSSGRDECDSCVSISRPQANASKTLDRFKPLNEIEHTWIQMFRSSFVALQERVKNAESAQLSQVLNRLRQDYAVQGSAPMERSVSIELCRNLFVLASSIGDPLPPNAQSDFQFFARLLLPSSESEDAAVSSCARVALISISYRVAI